MACQVEDVTADVLKYWIDSHFVTLIDVRDPDEFMKGRIPGATLMSMSVFDPKRIAYDEDKHLVFYCGQGDRSGEAAEIWAAQAPEEAEVFVLEGGIGSWQKAGYGVR